MPRFLPTALSTVLAAGLLPVLYYSLFCADRPTALTRLLCMGLGVHRLGIAAMWFLCGPDAQDRSDRQPYLSAG